MLQIQIFWLFLLSAYILGLPLNLPDSPQKFDGKITKTLDGELPLEYSEEIFTPVCRDGKCYPARLKFKYNMLGHFTNFEIDSLVPLTKNNHIKFSASDYEQLAEILRDRQSGISKLDPNYYTVEGETAVDAISGATSATINEMVVKGAAYTTVTLWHIANGWRPDSIFATTLTMVKPKHIDYLLSLKNSDALKMAFQVSLRHNDTISQIRIMEQIFLGTNTYLAWQVIAQSEKLIVDQLFAKWLSQPVFNQFNFQAQNKLVEIYFSKSELPCNQAIDYFELLNKQSEILAETAIGAFIRNKHYTKNCNKVLKNWLNKHPQFATKR